jgi:rhodanese-related sulfurtransferase
VKRSPIAWAPLLTMLALMTAPPVRAAETGQGATRPAIGKATLAEAEPVTPELSTDELREILAAGRDPVLDVRSAQEYAIAHIPGTVNLWEKEVETIVARYPERTAPLVLYCNGPFCGKSRRVSDQLLKKGYTNVRRYQLGLPVWRALGHTVQTDLAGFEYVFGQDRTAVYVDARSAEAFAAGTVPGAKNVRAGEAEVANEDGRLPHRDKGTRVIVFGADAKEARTVAEEIAHKAYWNSSYFSGTFADLALVVAKQKTSAR